jgi:hypothetical protein
MAFTEREAAREIFDYVVLADFPLRVWGAQDVPPSPDPSHRSPGQE